MKRIIEVGSKLRKKDSLSVYVEVTEFLPPKDMPPHARARVFHGNENLGLRLYSLAALQDSELFTPLRNTIGTVITSKS